MAEKIKIDIASSYDDKEAKAAIKDAEKIDKLKPEFEVDADVSRVLSAFDQVEAEAKAVAETAEVLGRALGPELASRADVTSIVNDLRSMGLTMDQIKGNADELGAKLKELSDADVGGKMGSSLGTARGKMDELGASANSSKSVLANMVGNTTQDLGALAGVSGSAGVAIGQMGEYMADAKSSGEGMTSVLKNFATVAGPIAAVAVATQLLSTYLKDVADAKAFDTKQVKTWKNAIQEADGVVEEMLEKARELEAIEFNADKWTIPGGAGFMHEVEDITALMYQAQITGEEWYGAMVAGGSAWSDMIKRIGSDTRLSKSEQDTLINAFADGYDDMVAATERAAQEQFVYGEAIEETTASVKKAVTIGDEYNRAQELAAEIAERNAEAHRDTADAINEQIAAQRSAVDSTFALHDAEASFAEAVAGVDEKVKSANGNLLKIRGVYEDVADAATDVADANVRVAEDTAKARGQVITATQKLDAWNDSMLEQVSTLKGPARQALLDYIANVNNIPPEKMTAIKAAIERGDLAEAQRLLDDASKTRKATITAQAETAAAEAAINQTARDRAVRLNLYVQNPRLMAAGGLGGGRTIVGEDGPELVDLPMGSRVYPAPVSSAMMHNGQAGGGTMTVNINMPKGSRGVDVVKQVAGQARRSGRRYGTPVVHYARR